MRDKLVSCLGCWICKKKNLEAIMQKKSSCNLLSDKMLTSARDRARQTRVTRLLFRRLLPGRRGPRVEVRGRVASAGAGGRQDKQTSAFAPLLLLSAPGSSVPQAAAACVSVFHYFRRPVSPGTSDIGNWVVGRSDPSRRRIGPHRSILVDWYRHSESIADQREVYRDDASECQAYRRSSVRRVFNISLSIDF